MRQAPLGALRVKFTRPRNSPPTERKFLFGRNGSPLSPASRLGATPLGAIGEPNVWRQSQRGRPLRPKRFPAFACEPSGGGTARYRAPKKPSVRRKRGGATHSAQSRSESVRAGRFLAAEKGNRCGEAAANLPSAALSCACEPKKRSAAAGRAAGAADSSAPLHPTRLARQRSRASSGRSCGERALRR